MDKTQTIELISESNTCIDCIFWNPEMHSDIERGECTCYEMKKSIIIPINVDLTLKSRVDTLDNFGCKYFKEKDK